MKFPLYVSEISKINLLEKWIIIHSILYYEKNLNIVPDDVYDRNMKMLDLMFKKFPIHFSESRYYKTFKDFDPSTGFDIPNKCKVFQPEMYEKLQEESEMLIEYAKKKWKIL